MTNWESRKGNNMMKSRFMMNLEGKFGEWWQKRAQEDIEKTRKELEAGEITIDDKGVARNCIGNIVMSDILEMLTFVTDRVNVEATLAAADEESHRWAAEYRAAMKNHIPTQEELFEMRAAFGEGATVIDVISGQTIQL